MCSDKIFIDRNWRISISNLFRILFIVRSSAPVMNLVDASSFSLNKLRFHLVRLHRQPGNDSCVHIFRRFHHWG